MKLSRRQIRALIMEELSVSNRKKPVNEGFMAGLGIAALATLAIAGMTGLQYLVLEVAIDKLVASDPRVKAKLAELDNMVKENPNMLPADIARMAAQKDAELAAIIDEIEAGAYGRATSAQSSTYSDF
tara:strand:+ start:1369 stop:1752 length:384 start_codon:yes stop_codon:yes gene_type:complete